MKIRCQNIYERTRLMLMKPETGWPRLLESDFTAKEIFRNYLLPVSVVTAVLVLLLSLLTYTALQSVGLAFINLLSSLAGTWFAYLITREYLCGKLNYHDNQALNLTVYSAAIFIIFHGIGAALGNIFIGQLFTLFSFILSGRCIPASVSCPGFQTGKKRTYW